MAAPRIYLDHNASTPLLPEVSELLRAAYSVEGPYGNPSSIHGPGRSARSRMEDARARVARQLGCEPKEIAFTASGSESDALALKGAFLSRKDAARRRVVTSTIEHPAILGALPQLERAGAEIVRVAPDPNGRVALETLLEVLTPATAVCSLMWANNETGVLQPVAEVARHCRKSGIVFHTDAVQVAGKQPIRLSDVDADLLTLSAHKFGGPQGVGVLVVRRGVTLESLVPGHQEGGVRGGTQNVAGIEAFALAFERSNERASEVGARMETLRDRFETAVIASVPKVRVNGRGAPRVPNTSNLQFEGADGEAILIALDLEGICVSAGAACASGSLKPSHVLSAMGLTPAQAHGSLRFSMGPQTTSEEVDRVVHALASHVPGARGAAAS